MHAAIAAPEPAGTPPAALLVAGPTCSGKSALALALARQLGGTVINADSMQIYRELRILTARPTPAEEALVPHALYGVRPAAEPGHVAWWRQAVLAEMAVARLAGRLPILCGGTGMYFAALTDGLADIPTPDPAARQQARRRLAELGPAGLHARLADADPATAAVLRPTDGQRLARAWEVLVSTGRGLAHWQTNRGPKPNWSFRAVLIDPPRASLRAAIATRCAAMVGAGALEEVRALLALGLDAALPAMRAHGVPEFGAHLAGRLTLPEAVARTALVTGQYTKRQATWFRGHMLTPPGHTRIINTRISYAEQFSVREWADLQNFILDLG
jgi:tRNA dimethylallyltransferase